MSSNLNKNPKQAAAWMRLGVRTCHPMYHVMVTDEIDAMNFKKHRLKFFQCKGSFDWSKDEASLTSRHLVEQLQSKKFVRNSDGRESRKKISDSDTNKKIYESDKVLEKIYEISCFCISVFLLI